MTKKISKIICLECNRNHQLYNEKILYEEEAIQSCIAWRKNTGWLKDIKIYGICNCIDQLNYRTIQKLRSLNVEIIRVDKFSDYSLYNKIYSQYWFEKNFINIYDYVIYSDLDFFIQKEVPVRLFQNKSVFLTYFNPFQNILDKKQASQLFYRYNNIINCGGKVFNTMFIINQLKNKINKTIIDTITNEKYEQFFNKNIKCDNCNYYLEEGVYDYLYLDKKINNQNSMILKLTPFVLSFFNHQHLYANNLNFLSLCQKYKQNCNYDRH